MKDNAKFWQHISNRGYLIYNDSGKWKVEKHNTPQDKQTVQLPVMNSLEAAVNTLAAMLDFEDTENAPQIPPSPPPPSGVPQTPSTSENNPAAQAGPQSVDKSEIPPPATQAGWKPLMNRNDPEPQITGNKIPFGCMICFDKGLGNEIVTINDERNPIMAHTLEEAQRLAYLEANKYWAQDEDLQNASGKEIKVKPLPT